MPGYEVELEEVNKDVVCGICLLTIKYAASGCSGNNHIYCHDCLLQLVETKGDNAVCPECRDKLNISPVGVMTQIINKLKVKCSFEGCSWKGDLIDLVKEEGQGHQFSCDYQLVPCVFHDCQQEVLKKDLKDHQDNCKNRNIECEHCNTTIQFHEKFLHYGSCGQVIVDCSFKGCNERIAKQYLDSHKQANTNKHLDLMMNNFHESENEKDELKKEITELKKKINKLEYTLMIEIKPKLENHDQNKNNKSNLSVTNSPNAKSM